MPANKIILKKTRMPPRRPAFPKNPVIKSYRPGARTKLRCSVLCNGGPWHGQRIMVNGHAPTMVFTLHGQTGRYKQGTVTTRTVAPISMKATTMMASAYVWEPV